MDSTEHATSALDAIETVAFKVGLKGYNVDEVDDFLERLATETRQLKDLVQQQRQQLRQASERIAQLDARGPVAATASPPPAPVARAGVGSAEQVTSMIAMAQQFIESAQHEAEEKAKELTTAAQERAREIVAEARSRAEDEVNRLNGLKQRLSEDVDTLARQLDAERARLGGWLAEFTRWVESSLQVASSPKAPARESAPPVAPPAPAAPVAPVSALRQTPPPAPPPASTIGQVLNFDQSSRD